MDTIAKICDHENCKMIIIDEILVSETIIEKQFLCNLQACKGACCIEGDYGAPLESEELFVLEEIYEKVKPFLRKHKP